VTSKTQNIQCLRLPLKVCVQRGPLQISARCRRGCDLCRSVQSIFPQIFRPANTNREAHLDLQDVPKHRDKPAYQQLVAVTTWIAQNLKNDSSKSKVHCLTKALFVQLARGVTRSLQARKDKGIIWTETHVYKPNGSIHLKQISQKARRGRWAFLEEFKI
jgi:hypothetical protein